MSEDIFVVSVNGIPAIAFDNEDTASYAITGVSHMADVEWNRVQLVHDGEDVNMFDIVRKHIVLAEIFKRG
jgi:hypothetical protein